MENIEIEIIKLGVFARQIQEPEKVTVTESDHGEISDNTVIFEFECPKGSEGSMTRRLNVTPGGCLFYDQDKEGYTVIGAKAIAANYEVIQKQSLGLDEYNLSASDGRNRRKENPGAAAEFG